MGRIVSGFGQRDSKSIEKERRVSSFAVRCGAEREMKRERGPETYEYLGKEYSSFTQNKIVCGIRTVTDWYAEQEILREATSIAIVEVMTTLAHLSTDFPFLVIELNRLHTVEILNKESSM